jgi:hypothetical protein
MVGTGGRIRRTAIMTVSVVEKLRAALIEEDLTQSRQGAEKKV